MTNQTIIRTKMGLTVRVDEVHPDGSASGVVIDAPYVSTDPRYRGERVTLPAQVAS